MRRATPCSTCCPFTSCAMPATWAQVRGWVAGFQFGGWVDSAVCTASNTACPHSLRGVAIHGPTAQIFGTICSCVALLYLLAECDSPYDTRYKPERILLYDKHPGGIGLAAAVSAGCLWMRMGVVSLQEEQPERPCMAGVGMERAQHHTTLRLTCWVPTRPPLSPRPLPHQAAPLFPQLLRRALALVCECGCTGRTGCPACVQHTECGEYNAALHKRAAAAVLAALVEGEPQPIGQAEGGLQCDGEELQEAAADQKEPLQ